MSLVKHDQILSSFSQLPINARIIVSLVFKNIIVRAAVLFSEIYDFGYIGTNFVIV